MGPRLRALHRAEDIGSALKGGVNICQRQPVNEVFGPLVTKFVPILAQQWCLLRLYVFNLNNALYSTRPHNEGRRFQCQLIAVNARIEYAIVPGESLI